jgi:hypothetical protein
MPAMNTAFWLLIGLALAIAGVLTVLDEILSDTPHTEPDPLADLESKNTERRSSSECRT